MSRSQSNGHRPTSPPLDQEASIPQAEMAQAFRDLARGEQQAAAIEANLANLESKLDALLASIDAAETDAAKADGNEDGNSKRGGPSEKST